MLDSWAHPINADSDAMKDGRASRPPPPDFVQDELTCRAINKFLGTTYTVEQIADMPAAWVDKMMLLVRYMSA